MARGFHPDVWGGYRRRSGRPLEAALARSREQFAELLPAGLATEHSWLLRIIDAGGVDFGVLWLGPHGRTDAAYVFDIDIDEAHRRRGLARAALTMAEDLVRDAGFTELGLNVFGFNNAARRLYDSLGYPRRRDPDDRDARLSCSRGGVGGLVGEWLLAARVVVVRRHWVVPSRYLGLDPVRGGH